MEYTREIIDISSDEDEAGDLRVSVETRGQPGVKEKVNAGDGRGLPAGASVDVSDDDECLILDGVPQSGTTDAVFTELGSELVDEMLIVGEKGQFACRDYPHPRYLCATFLFSMTPHRKHCAMCHCYVCDCLAPCTEWDSHCSSTHKDHAWRAERLLCRRRRREQQRAILKPAPSPLPRSDDRKPANQHHPMQLAYKGPDQAVSKLSRSARASCGKPPHVSTGAAAPRPKDILCELYKICPAVISCRRRIPPSLSPPEQSETEQDD